MPNTNIPPLCPPVLAFSEPAEYECELGDDESVVRVDTDGDGVFDVRVVRRFDNRGYPRSDWIYQGAESRPTSRTRYRHDRRGRLRRERVDTDGDGHSDCCTTYSYTRDGHPQSEEIDSDCDGATDSLTRWLYDDEGDLERVEYRYSLGDDLVDTNCRYDPPCAPPFNTCWESQACWEDGRAEPTALRQLDDDALAALGHIACPEHLYCSYETAVCGCDATGRPVIRAADLDDDGMIDEYRTLRYDETTGGYSEATDIGADGVFEVENHFDSADRLIAAWWDDDGDGVPDRGSVYTWRADGPLLQTDTIVSGQLHSRTTYTYDDRGNNTLVERDDWGDGQPDFQQRYQYDEHGRVVQTEWDCNADGRVEETMACSFNEDGQRQVLHGNPDFSCTSLQYRPPEAFDTSVDFPNRSFGIQLPDEILPAN